MSEYYQPQCVWFIFYFISRLWNDSLWEIARDTIERKYTSCINLTTRGAFIRFQLPGDSYRERWKRQKMKITCFCVNNVMFTSMCASRLWISNFPTLPVVSKNITHFLPNSFVLLFRSFSLAILILRKNFELDWRSIKFISSFIECLQTSHRLIGANWFQLKCFE